MPRARSTSPPMIFFVSNTAALLVVSIQLARSHDIIGINLKK